jgi:hypothetical protein
MSIKGKITLLKRWTGIVLGKNRVAVEQGEGKLYSKTDIKGYYNDLTGKVHDKTITDENGCVQNIIQGGQKVYFPISIFQYALGCWDLYLESSSPEMRKAFLTQCDWIIKDQRGDGSWNCFEPIGYTTYSVSSMGQGEAISVLLRAYTLTGDEKWLNSAKKAVEFMKVEVKDGGVLLKDGEDVSLEEYPALDSKRVGVLNGWIFSLFGLYDYVLLTGDSDIKELFDKSVETLIKNKSDYDMGFWSYYDRSKSIASPAYHDLHIALLNVLSDITGRGELREFAQKLEKYKKSSFNRLRAVIKKARQKIGESPEGIVVQ